VQAEQPGSMQKYLKYLKKIDIGIAMINENDFSLGRSDGKFLEYASRGVIAVCQNRGSYAETVIHGETGFLFDNAASLLEILNQLLQNKTLRQQTRTKAYHYICNDRTHKHGAIKRLKFYQSLIDNAFNPSVLTTHGKKGFKERIHLRAMLLHRDQHFEEALTIYMSLLEIQPEFHVIWMRLRDLYQTIGSQAQIDLCNAEIDRLTA